MEPLPVLQVHGASHSGSTLLGLMLGKHSRIYNVGEWINYCTEYFTHWGADLLVKRREGAHAGGHAKYAPHCSICGAACAVLPGGEAHLMLPLAGHYQALMEHLHAFKPGASAICDTSKWSAFHALMAQHAGASVRFVPVITQKPVYGFAASMFKVACRLGEEPDVTPEWAAAQANAWCTAHEGYLDAAGPTARVVPYRALVTEPDRVLRGVLALLDLPFEPGLQEYWTVTPHQIAGNPGAHANLRGLQTYVGEDNQLYVDHAGIVGLRRDVPPEDVRHVAGQALRAAELSSRVAKVGARLSALEI